MAYENNDDLDRARAALDVFTVWRAAYRDGLTSEPPPHADGVVKSPFREDGARGSFSIIGGGKGWKDHGGQGDKGDTWDMVAKFWPNETKGETAKRVIELSGIIPTPPRKKEEATAPTSMLAMPESFLRAAKSIEKRRKAAELEDRIYEEREKLLLPPSVKWAPTWPECVAEMWADGVDHLAGDPARMADVAKSRGWPVQWVEELASAGKMAYPWERGATPGAKWAARQRAFIVEQPRMVEGAVSLTPVGYHQHWFVPPRGDMPAQKGWLYLPSVPKKAPRNDYERALLTFGAINMSFPPSPKALVPPLPFVLGDLAAPRLVVILEGQWDAITFYGACGFFHDTAEARGVVVFGIRGAQGLDAFMGHWAPWLRKHRPRAWVIADNDAAGGSWRTQPEAPVGMPRPPSLGDRLVAAGCAGGEKGGAAPVVSWLKPGKWGKDFNDYFKAYNGRLGPQQMGAWMRTNGMEGIL